MSKSFEESAHFNRIQKKWTFNRDDNNPSEGLGEFLKENGFVFEDLNKANRDGWTPLTLAVSKGEFFAVYELIHRLADVNKPNRNNDTPIVLALKLLDQNPHFQGTYDLLVRSGAKLPTMSTEELSNLSGPSGVSGVSGLSEYEEPPLEGLITEALLNPKQASQQAVLWSRIETLLEKSLAKTQAANQEKEVIQERDFSRSQQHLIPKTIEEYYFLKPEERLLQKRFSLKSSTLQKTILAEEYVENAEDTLIRKALLKCQAKLPLEDESEQKALEQIYPSIEKPDFLRSVQENLTLKDFKKELDKLDDNSLRWQLIKANKIDFTPAFFANYLEILFDNNPTELLDYLMSIKDYSKFDEEAIYYLIKTNKNPSHLSALLRHLVKNNQKPQIELLLNGVILGVEQGASINNTLLFSFLANISNIEGENEKTQFIKKIYNALKLPALQLTSLKLPIPDTSPELELEILKQGISIGDFDTVDRLLKENSFLEAFKKLDPKAYQKESLATQTALLTLKIKHEGKGIDGKNNPADFRESVYKILIDLGIIPTQNGAYYYYQWSDITATDILDHITKSEYFDEYLLDTLIEDYKITLGDNSQDIAFCMDELFADYPNRHPKALLSLLKKWKTHLSLETKQRILFDLYPYLTNNQHLQSECNELLKIMLEDFDVENKFKKSFIDLALERGDRTVLNFLKEGLYYSHSYRPEIQAKMADYVFTLFCKLTKQNWVTDEDLIATCNTILTEDSNYFKNLIKHKSPIKSHKAFTDVLVYSLQNKKHEFFKFILDKVLVDELGNDLIYGLIDVAKASKNRAIYQLLVDRLPKDRTLAETETLAPLPIKNFLDKEKEKDERITIDRKTKIDVSAASVVPTAPVISTVSIAVTTPLPPFEFQTNLEIFSQMQNDYQISGSTLEGNTFKNTEGYINNMVGYILKNKDNPELAVLASSVPELEKVKKQLDSFEESYKLIEACRKEGCDAATLSAHDTYRLSLLKSLQGLSWGGSWAQSEELHKILEKNYQKKLAIRSEHAEKIVNLTENQNNILLPCGWLPPKGDDAGHAMLMRIEKTDNKPTFRMIIYNTGSGLEKNHKQILDKTKIKYCPVKVFDNLDHKAIKQAVENIVLQPQVNSYLYEDAEDWRWSKYRDKVEFNGEDIYKEIDQFKKNEVDPLQHFPRYITPQRAGTCASKVFSPFFTDMLGDKAKLYKYKSKELMNNHFIQQLEHEQKQKLDKISRTSEKDIKQEQEKEKEKTKKDTSTEIDEDSISQLEHSLHNFARMLRKLQKKDLLSSDTIQSSLTKIKEQDKLVKSLKKTYREKQEKEQEKFVVQKLTAFPAGVAAQRNWKNYTDSNQLIFKKESQEKRKILPFKKLNFKNFELAELSGFADTIDEYYRNGQFQEVKNIVEQYVTQWLPIPALQKQSLEDLRNLTLQLRKLSLLYNYACLEEDGMEATQSSVMINALFCLFNKKLLSNHSFNFLDTFNLKKDYNDKLGKFNGIVNSPFFNLTDPDWLKVLDKLKSEIQAEKKDAEPDRLIFDKKTEALDDSLYGYISVSFPNLRSVIDILLQKQQAGKDVKPPKVSQKIDKINEFLGDEKLFTETLIQNEQVPPELGRKAIEEFIQFHKERDLSIIFKDTMENLSPINDKYEKLNINSCYEEPKLFTRKPILKTVAPLPPRPVLRLKPSTVLSLPMESRYPNCQDWVVKFVLQKGQITNPNEIQKIDFPGYINEKEKSLAKRLLHLKVDKGNQIFSTLEFFANNRKLFCGKDWAGYDTGKDYQLLFHCNLFEPGVLQNELLQNKNLSNHIISFLEEGIRHYREEQCLLPAGAFLYEQAALLMPHISDTDKILQNLTREVDYFRKLEKTLPLTFDKRLAYGRLCKVAAYRLLLELTANPTVIDEKKLNEFYVLYTKSKQLNITNPTIDESTKLIESKIKELMAKYRSVLDTEYNKKGALEKLVLSILEKNFSEKYKDFKDQPLTILGEYPVFRVFNLKTQETIKIDLKTGQIYLKGEMQEGYLPKAIRDMEDFKRTFGDINPKALISPNQDVFEFEHLGLNYRIIYKEIKVWSDNKYKLLEIQLKIMDKNQEYWCTRSSSDIYGGGHLWGGGAPLTINSDYNFFEGPNDFFGIPKGGNKPALKAGPNNRLFLIDETGAETSFCLRRNKLKESPYQSEEEVTARKNEIQSKEAANLSNAFALFEDPDCIEIYDNTKENEPPIQVKLPRYNLHFISKWHNNQWQLFLKDKPNCRLILNEPKPLQIKNFNHWLYLEDIEANPPEKFAFIPFQAYSGEPKKEGKDRLPTFNLSGKKEDTTKKIFYKLEQFNDLKPGEILARKRLVLGGSESYLKFKFEQDKFISERGEGLCYLAYVNLYQMDSNNAYQFLTQGINATPLSGTEKEQSILNEIFLNSNNQKVSDIFQRSGFLSVQLQAAYLLMKNFMEVSPEILKSYYDDDDFSPKLVKTLTHYLDTLKNTPIEMRLPPEVENTLFKFIANHPKLDFKKLPKSLYARYKNLQGWEVLKERQILMNKKPSRAIQQRLTELDKILNQNEVTMPYAIDFEAVHPKPDELVDIPKYLTDDFDKMLKDKKSFIANFGFLLSFALIKEPLETSYCKELAQSLGNKKQKLIKSIVTYLDKLEMRDVKVIKSTRAQLNTVDKLVLEYAKTLLVASQYPEKYADLLEEIQGSKFSYSTARKKSPLEIVECVNAFQTGIEKQSIMVELPISPSIIEKQWPVQKVVPLELLKDKPKIDKDKSKDKKEDSEQNTLKTLYTLPEPESFRSTVDLKTDAEDPFLNTLPKDVKADFVAGKKRNDKERHFRAFCGSTLKEFIKANGKKLEDDINKDIKKYNSDIEALTTKMLNLANKQFETTQKQIAHLGQESKLLSMDDLLNIYLDKDLNAYSRMTGLQPNEIKAMHADIHQWLLKTTLRQQLNRANKQLGLLKDKDPTNAEYDQILNRLGSELYAKRQYDPYQHPELLFFEYFEDKLIRDAQVSMLSDILNTDTDTRKDKISQLIMGGGKTTVIAPLAAKLNAQGDRLFIIEVPPALFETNFNDLQSVAQKFNQKVIPFKFVRDAFYSSQFLENLYHRFRSCMLQKNYIATTGTSIRSMALKRWDLLEALELEPNNEELWLQLEWLEKSIELVRNAVCFMDEVDSNLNIQQDLNYPSGKEQGLDAVSIQAIQELYTTLPKLEEVKSLQELLKIYSNKPKNYIQTKLKSLAEILIKQPDTLLAKIVQNLKNQEVENLLAYLNNISKTDLSFLTKLTKEQRGILAIYRHQINNLFISTLPKRFNEHYGYSQLPSNKPDDVLTEIPIPYSASHKPKEGCQFANIYTGINYAVQAQYLNGISLASFQKIVKTYKEKALEEFNTNRTSSMLTPSDTKTAGEFKKLTGLTIPLTDIDISNNNLITELWETTKTREPLIDYALQHYVLPAVTTHSKILSMNAIQHASIYKNILGVSGTTYNWRACHQRFEYDEKNNLGIDGQTVDWLRRKETKIVSTGGVDVNTILGNYFKQVTDPDKVHALIDVGALFNDYTNEAVVEAIVDQLQKYQKKPCQYILYFNDKNILYARAINDTNKPPIPIEVGTTDIIKMKKILKCEPEQWFCYYDQAHTTGTDIKHALDAKAVVTFNKDTTFRDYVQGITRMRGFAEDQVTDFIIPDDLNQDLKGKPSAENLVEISLNNQAEPLLLQHYTSAVRKIQNIFREKLEKYLDTIKDRKQKLTAYKAFADFFAIMVEIDPVSEFGNLETEKDTLETLQSYHENCLKLWENALTTINVTPPESLKTQLNNEADKIIKDIKPFLPKTIKERKSQNLDANVEGQKQSTITVMAEQKQEKMALVDAQREEYVSREVVDHKLHIAVTHQPWTKESFEAWSAGKFEKSEVPAKLETVLEDGAQLNLNPELTVSQNYKNTFNNTTKVEGDSKKPIEYILMKQDKGRTYAMVVTQIEASELAKFINAMPNESGRRNDDRSNEKDIWIETTQGSLFAGIKPKEPTNDMREISEQLQFCSGQLERLEENLSKNIWFTPKNAKSRIEYYKKHILPDEPLSKDIFPFVQKRLLEQLPTEKLPSEKLLTEQPKAMLTAFDAQKADQIIDKVQASRTRLSDKLKNKREMDSKVDQRKPKN